MAQRDNDMQVVVDCGIGDVMAYTEVLHVVMGRDLTPAQAAQAVAAANQGPTAFDAYMMARSPADAAYWTFLGTQGANGADVKRRLRIAWTHTAP